MGTNTSILPPIDDLAELVESGLREIVTDGKLGLYDMMAYHMGWKEAPGIETFPSLQNPNRHRGIACLLSSAAVGGEAEPAVPAAVAVELVEAFSQVHDDVQGGQPKRKGRDAVWWIWGPAQAINVGDGLHALSRLALFDLKQNGLSQELTVKAVQMLDEAGLDLCEGIFRDLDTQERIDIDIGQYLEMASSKTGALFSCSMGLGALIGKKSQDAVASMSKCGRKLGIAFQINNDLKELWGSGSDMTGPSSEVLNKKKLLPVAHALNKAEISEKRRLGDIYFKRVLEQKDVDDLLEILEEMGSRQFSEDLVNSYKLESLDAMESEVLPGKSESMRNFIDSLVD